MTNRLSWIRRQTTVEDLLDDGVENFSDLKASDTAVPEEPDPDPVLIATNQQFRDQARREREQAMREAYRSAFSGLGIFLGLLMTISGAALVLLPVDTLVYHARVRYLRSVVERVTPARSVFYGASLAISGIGIIGYALYHPRRP